MLSKDDFQKSIEIGTAAEDIVYSYLRNNNSFVQDIRRQTHEDFTGPRLKGTEGELVLPDFAVYNKNPNKGNFAVDVKFKSSVYTINGKKCFTVDNKFEDYRLATQVLKLDFLMIVFMFKDRMYFYRESDYIGTTIFKNQYGRGNVYLFEFDSKRITY